MKIVAIVVTGIIGGRSNRHQIEVNDSPKITSTNFGPLLIPVQQKTGSLELVVTEIIESMSNRHQIEVNDPKNYDPKNVVPYGTLSIKNQLSSSIGKPRIRYVHN